MRRRVWRKLRVKYWDYKAKLECANCGVRTQQEALDYLEQKDLFKTMQTVDRNLVDKKLVKKSSSKFDFSQHILNDAISGGLERALSTANWVAKRFRVHRKGVTQVLARPSYIQALGFLAKIQPQFEKLRKVSAPRTLQPSQWGMLCPCDTPEGEFCGLVKYLALMTNVTTDEEEGPLIYLCYCLGVEDLELLSGEELHSPNSFLLIFDGLILGKHGRPQYFATALMKLRRSGKIGEFVNVFVNEKQCCVCIASDGGHVCRPLVIADKGVPRIKEHHMKELMDGVRTFDDFLREDLIEYLDVNEENNALIALYEDKAEAGTIHIEIDPFTILGVIASLIPYPHHNQSPGNTYQCAMGKQARGNIAYNQMLQLRGFFSLLRPSELVWSRKFTTDSTPQEVIHPWHRPPPGSVVTHVDASADKLGGAIAWVTRNSDGEILRHGVQWFPKETNTVKLELKVLEVFTAIPPLKGVSHIICSDNEGVLSMIEKVNSGKPLKGEQWRDIVENICLQLEKNFPEDTELIHIPGDFNSLADCLANGCRIENSEKASLCEYVDRAKKKKL